MTNSELKALTVINSDDLEGECITLPERLVYLYDLYANADYEYNRQSEALTVACANKYIEYRDHMIANGIKPTENLVTNYVQADPVLLGMTEKKYDLKRQKDFLYGLLQGMNAKRENIKTLSFLRRNDERF